MTNFTFSTANTIIFGAGSVEQVAAKSVAMGKHPLLVMGGHPERASTFVDMLENVGLEQSHFSISGEPEIESITAGAAVAREADCDLVIGFGGGSVIDSAKAIAALATNTRPIETYLEVIGDGQPLDQRPLPCIAIPTTAGTGTEVTRNAVLKSARHKVKVSLRSPHMLPDLAVVDPKLTLSLPADITAATGCDALTQLLEAFVSAKANPMTDALCREALPQTVIALPRAVTQGDDLQARTDMALASLFSGLALANGGLGAVHGIAGPLGGMIDAPHGALCARLLPLVVATNVAALEQRQPDSVALERYTAVARWLTRDAQAKPEDALQWLEALTERLAIPTLQHWGFSKEDIPTLVGKAQRASSMKGNPIRLTEAELKDIITQALG